MKRYLDSSVLVASLLSDDPDYLACDALLSQAGNWTSPHALNETFATLTGGRLGVRIDADVAAQIIRESIVPRVSFAELNACAVIEALADAKKHGVRGGAVYDYMHLVAARKIQADKLITINLSDFNHLRRESDPVIDRP
jgi:predicted nucleic acid-binding protein